MAGTGAVDGWGVGVAQGDLGGTCDVTSLVPHPPTCALSCTAQNVHTPENLLPSECAHYKKHYVCFYVGIKMLVNIKMFDFTQVLGTKIVGITKEEERKEDYRLSVGFSFR